MEAVAFQREAFPPMARDEDLSLAVLQCVEPSEVGLYPPSELGIWPPLQTTLGLQFGGGARWAGGCKKKL